jgi:hypothetical protein
VIAARPTAVLALACLLASAWACGHAAGTDIYKRVLPNGTVVYSDQPGPGAKKVEPPPSQVIDSFTPTEQPSPPPEPESRQAAPFYTRLAITSPAADEVLWEENSVEVAVGMEPALNADEGHSLVLLLDGQPVVEAGQGSRFQLDEVTRGSHSLSARIEDSDGRVLIESDPVTFHVRQHSVLMPPPRTPTPQPPPFQPRPQQPPFQRTPQPPPFGG